MGRWLNITPVRLMRRRFSRSSRKSFLVLLVWSQCLCLTPTICNPFVPIERFSLSSVIVTPILTAYIISASRNLSYILQIPPCSASSGQVRGRHDALPSLCLNSRVLPRSLSFCPRSGEGRFCRPTLLPWSRSTRLRLTPAAYLSCHSCRGLLP